MDWFLCDLELRHERVKKKEYKSDTSQTKVRFEELENVLKIQLILSVSARNSGL